MRDFLTERYPQEAPPAGTRRSSTEELIDVADGDIVLHFTYRYLEAHSLPPSDDEVHSVTAAIARYNGPQVVSWAVLESFLAGVLLGQRA